MVQNREFIQEFVDEAIVHVENVERDLLKLEEEGGNAELINGIFRAVHSIKGTAGFFSLKNIISLSHAMENLFGEIRNGSIELKYEMIDVMLGANDYLREMIQDIDNSEEYDLSRHLANINAILNGEGSNTSGKTKEIPNNDMLSAGRIDGSSDMDDGQRDIIIEGRKHGHKLYKIHIKLNTSLKSYNNSPVKFFKKIESIGNIVDAHSDISEVDSLNNVLESDISFVFIFTTVLEKNLVALALDIPEADIEELDVDTKKEDYETILTQKSSVGDETNLSNDVLSAVSPTGGEITPKYGSKPDVELKKNVKSGEDNVRVHVGLLNDLLNLASELVLGRNQLLRTLEPHRKDIVGLDSILQNVDHITTELQEKVMQTRMQPIANVFNRVPRVIRELSKKLQKDVDLVMEGTDVELDKSIIESLADPLVHLIRNAVDHGIEPPDVREAMGKSKTGTITLRAYHEGGHVTIDVCDDGGGIDRGKILSKAIQKGLITPEDGDKMGEREILDLLFKPGFSTAVSVTDVSGRGVGMDVVKTNIEKLGGAIEITTALARGTTFRMNLPLTLAIISSIIVEVAGQRFALPQVNLQEMVRIKPGDETRKIEYLNGSKVLRLRGKLLPIVDLCDVMGLGRSEGIDDSSGDNRIIRILVLKIGSKRFGLSVDIIHDGEEILVKPLPRYLKNSQCYSGVTILGDGSIAMILDPEAITVKSDLKYMDNPEELSGDSDKELSKEKGESQNLLLYKCSGPETFAIDLSMVARVEEIHPDLIEKIGTREYIQYRGTSLQVIRPEHYLPVEKGEMNNERLYVIIPKLVKHPVGILIDKILDTMETNVVFDEETIREKGVVGTTILKDKIVLIINIYELFEMAVPEFYADRSQEQMVEGKTVLVAEDTPFFAKLERDYLEGAGYRVIMAGNGKEALAVLEKNHVDAVISDINMPVMDGLELVQRIRSDPRLSSIPVIAVTSMSGDGQKRHGLKAGFDYYETKLDRERLLQTLKDVVKKGRSKND